MSDSLRPHPLEHVRMLCLPLSPQIHGHWISDASQPSHPLPPPSPFALIKSFPASGSFPMSLLITSGSQSTGALLLFCPLVFWLWAMWILAPKPWINIHWIQHSLDHWKSKRIPEKYLLLFYWLCQSLWLWGSQQTVENSERDGNTRPLDLPPEKSVCRSRSNT